MLLLPLVRLRARQTDRRTDGQTEMCTLEKRGNVFVLAITGPGEHRLNPTLVGSLRSALCRVREEPNCSALVTTAEGKFFSNGYDLSWAQNHRDRLELMSSELRALVRDLISLPMPTIAAVTGHASAAGLILALSHDYVLMRKDRGFLYMSEVDIGLVLANWFVTLIRSKIGSPAARREMLMKAAKLTAAQGAAMGIIDSVHDGPEETIRAAIRLAEELVVREWDGHVYAANRMVVLREVLDSLGSDEAVEAAANRASSKL
ncbi:enoyl-CoA delta isomerase 1, peroxisomal-like [Punica granatum]|uniref:Delta(3)-Delta(2)-enoyl-CoA isomerase n=1 Tax=Punica granatum TaxID=22663 RepID=A0A6P8C0E9_PUNGR|nr:enoyl-CoA delta isomerase 1, peroxisomal-like [Punica granatum]